MNDSFCASVPEIERYRGVNFLLAQFVGAIAALINFLSTPFAVYYINKRTIFGYSTKVLIFQMLFYATMFQMIYGFEVGTLLNKGLFKHDQPCELLTTEADCKLQFNFLIVPTSGMIYGLTGLMLERAFATFFESATKNLKLTISIVVCAVVGISSLVTPYFMLWDDPLENYAFACYVIPRQSVGRATKFYGVSTILIFIDKMVMRFMKSYNEKFEYKNRFNFSARFHNRQAIESTVVICFLARILLVMFLIYTLGIGLLLNIKKDIPLDVFGVLISWAYTIPFASAMMPPILIWRIQKTRVERSGKSTAETKQTVDVYFVQMNQLWA